MNVLYEIEPGVLLRLTFLNEWLKTLDEYELTNILTENTEAELRFLLEQIKIAFHSRNNPPIPPEEEITAPVMITGQVVAAKGLRVRSGPGVQNPVVDTLEYGRQIIVERDIEETVGGYVWRKLDEGRWAAERFGSSSYFIWF